jgi:hypothetical protein
MQQAQGQEVDAVTRSTRFERRNRHQLSVFETAPNERSTPAIEHRQEGTKALRQVGTTIIDGGAPYSEPRRLRDRLVDGLPASISAAELGALEFEDEYADAAARLMRVRIARPEIKTKTGRWVVQTEGRWRYTDPAYLRPVPLAQYFADRVSRRCAPRPAPELTRWTRRLLVEAGLVDLAPRQLWTPADSHGTVVVLARTIGHLASLRALAGDLDPLPLGSTFLVDWSAAALSYQQVYRAKRFLENCGVIVRVDVVDVHKPRPLVLWAVARWAEP